MTTRVNIAAAVLQKTLQSDCIRAWSKRLAVLSALLVLILILLSLSPPSFHEYIDYLGFTLLNLTGHGVWSDISQDYFGLRAVLARSHAYAPIGELYQSIGLNYPVLHASTHPPVAFLLTAPVVFLPYAPAVAVWYSLMIVCILASVLLFGFSIRWVLFSLLLCFLWPPAFTALGQLTPLWLFGTALAYRFRRTSPGWSGAGIALASLTKYFPALLLLLHLRKRRWKAILAFSLVWLAALLLLLVLHPAVFTQYIQSNQTAAPYNLARIDNGSIFAVLYHTAGLPGIALSLILLISLSIWILHSHTSIWLLGIWLSVALLPISWIYSILPLLPLLFFALRSRRWPATLFALIPFILPFYAQFGPASAPVVALSVIAVGFALIDIRSTGRLEHRF